MSLLEVVLSIIACVFKNVDSRSLFAVCFRLINNIMEEPKRKKAKKSKKRIRKENRQARELEEERLLASSLFGRADTLIEASILDSTQPQSSSQTKAELPEFAFEIDCVGDATALDNDDEKEAKGRNDKGRGSDGDSDDDDASAGRHGCSSGAVWVDEDDAEVKMSLTSSSSRLRKLRTARAEDGDITGFELEQ